ncbi:DUF4142 domain-containing protein [Marivirga sp.]|uniref:DUF4142 domain-containing protein n=1 Tax=Marivirga sp. TaxID=2018662 RepID=UPI0025E8B822|nr:DUF4142 domain-containing protein [Marivirga sp.]
MKKNHYIKGTLLQVTLVASILLFAACDNNQNQQGSKASAEELNDEKFDNNKQEEDAEFLVEAAEINLKEIHLGQLAQQNGSATYIKELGRMMEEAHSKSQNDLNILAKSKNISIPSTPSDDSNDAYTNLNEKSGNDFDEAYADKMVDEHQDAIKAFEQAAENINDSEIKNWARATLPNLRKHLDHAIECQNKSDNI